MMTEVMSEAIDVSKTISIPDMVFRNIESAMREHTKTVVTQLASFYGFDVEDAMSRLSLDIKPKKAAPKKKASDAGEGDVSEKKAKKVKAPRVERVVPSIPLPWCGTVMDDWCMAIRSNHGLFTQCTSLRDGDSQMCKACGKAASKSTSGASKFGLISERDSESFTQKVTPYASVMKKQNITKEVAIAEAEKFGWVISDAIFDAAPAKRGRKKSDTSSSDDKSASPKKRGRPTKEKPVASASAVEDKLNSMIAQAGGLSISDANDNSSKAGDSEASPKKRTLTDEQKAKMAAGKARKAEQKRLETAAKAAAEAEAIRKAAAEAEALRLAAEAEAARNAEKRSQAIEEAAADELFGEDISEESSEREGTEEEESSEREDTEEEEESSERQDTLELVKMVIKGTTYLIEPTTNDVYEMEDGDYNIIGKYDPKKKKVTLHNE